MLFIEATVFTRRIVELRAENHLRELQSLLLAHPDAGDVVSGLDGLRKIRMPLPGRGKRGAARVLYLHIAGRDKIVFLLVYKKNDFDDLPPEVIREMKEKIKVIRREFEQ
ncbi:MAG: type II toxin-antitoxin system RelE/ParE family toxin [Kiritimatiellaeota bacterium]|nr:type II toxin-antitoxin system RelE/ParE family toxin [Kiritimatiellota bacterium]